MDQARWEFLVIGGDIAAYKTIIRTLANMNPVVDYTSGIATARAFIERRKLAFFWIWNFPDHWN
jgi:hypothetical protein